MTSSRVLPALLIALISSASISLHEAWGTADQQFGRRPEAYAHEVDVHILDRLTSSEPADPREFFISAQADAFDDAESNSHQLILESILQRGDIMAAKAFVNALANTNDIAPAIIRSMNDRIWRTKVDRMAEYSEKIREAIASSDFEAVRDHSERMRRLTTAEPSNDPTLTDHVATRGSAAAIDLTPRTRGGPPIPDADVTGRSKPSSITEDTAIVRQMQRALEEDRLFPPTEDNAFDLAATRLSMEPGDPEVHSVLHEVIEKQQAKVSDNLREGRPEAALNLANQLRNSLGHLGAEAAWPSNYRSQVLGWVDEIQQDIVAGLVVSTEKAIEERQLTIAPEGETSAQRYVELIASQLGHDHAEVAQLATEIIVSYRDLVDERLARQQYDRALRLHSRMEAISTRFGVSIDQVAALKTDIEAIRVEQQQHDQLLLLAAYWRDKGQLIEPAGANALEFAGKAVRLAVNPAAANKVFNDLIIEQRRRIDRLIEAGRLQEAVSDLQRLGAAIEQIDSKQAGKAAEYYAEAEQVLRQADLENSRRQQLTKDAKENSPVAPPEISRNSQSPFTFINPF